MKMLRQPIRVNKFIKAADKNFGGLFIPTNVDAPDIVRIQDLQPLSQ